MADVPSKPGGFLSALSQLGSSIADLIRAFEGKPPLDAASPVDDSSDPPAQLALPPGEAHSVAAQLLTQHTPGWHTPRPDKLPVPTYAPAMTAFGIVFIALGAVTVWPLSVIGAAIFMLAIAKWIGELLHA